MAINDFINNLTFLSLQHLSHQEGLSTIKITLNKKDISYKIKEIAKIHIFRRIRKHNKAYQSFLINDV